MIVCLTVDDRFISLALACVNSIVDTRLYSKDEISVNILCFEGGLSQENIAKLKALSSKNTIVNVAQLGQEYKEFCDTLCDKAKRSDIPTNPIVWLRLLLPKLFTDQTVVYVDADICVRSDLKQLIDEHNTPTQPIIGFRHRRQGVADIIENSITAAFFVYNLNALNKDEWFDSIEKHICDFSNDDYLLQVLFKEFEHKHSLPQELFCNRVSTQQIPKASLENEDFLLYVNKRFDEQYCAAKIVHYAGEPKPSFDGVNFTDSLFIFNYLAAKRKMKLVLDPPKQECEKCKV